MKKANQPKFIQREDGSWYYNGDLNLRNKEVSSIIWPKNLTVNGNLDLCESSIKILPDNLTISGWLDLKGCKEITHLPKNLKCRSLFIKDTNIKEIKKDVKINTTLYLSSISEIKFEEGFFCEGIKFNGYRLDGVNKKLFNSLPKSLIRYFVNYIYIYDNSYCYFNTNTNIIRRNLRNTYSLYYRFFRVESKEELIRGLYEKGRTT